MNIIKLLQKLKDTQEVNLCVWIGSQGKIRLSKFGSDTSGFTFDSYKNLIKELWVMCYQAKMKKYCTLIPGSKFSLTTTGFRFECENELLACQRDFDGGYNLVEKTEEIIESLENYAKKAQRKAKIEVMQNDFNELSKFIKVINNMEYRSDFIDKAVTDLERLRAWINGTILDLEMGGE